MAESVTDPFLVVTDSIMRRLARDGIQEAATLRDWAAEYSVDFDEWLEWAAAKLLVEPVFGAGVSDHSSRWAVNGDLVAEYAVEEATKRSGATVMAVEEAQMGGAAGVQANRHSPSYDEISERAYFISLEQGGEDEVANWVRAERELARA